MNAFIMDAILMPMKFKCQRYFKFALTVDFLNSSLDFNIEPQYHNRNANIFSPLNVCTPENWTLHFTH